MWIQSRCFHDLPRRMSVIVVRETPNIWARAFRVRALRRIISTSDSVSLTRPLRSPLRSPLADRPRVAISVPVGHSPACSRRCGGFYWSHLTPAGRGRP